MRVTWWLATVWAVGTMSIILSHQRALDPLQNLSLRLTAPVAVGLLDIASPINDVIDGITDHGGLVRENQRLRDQLELLQRQLAGQQQAQQRIQELEDALHVKQSQPADQLLAASVIAQEPSGLKRAIAIDRGTSDGVDEGMVILSRNGSLIGTVSRAYADFAWVRLVTDPESAVNAQVDVAVPQPSPQPSPPASPPAQAQASATPAPTPAISQTPTPQPTPSGPVRGVAEGDIRQGLLLNLLPPETRISPGSLVLTSGLGGNYPAGLLIGAITSVEERPQSPFKRATVEPATNLSDLDTVLVIMNFKPKRLSPP